MNLNELDWSSPEYDGLFEKEVPSQLLKNPLLQKNVWRIKEDLGLDSPEHNKRLTINFGKIQPKWLNLVAKIYILTIVNTKPSCSTIRKDLSCLTSLAKFLKEKQIEKIKYINNELFEEYDYWIHLSLVKKDTICLYYSAFEKFFNICSREGWLDINTYWFKKRKKRLKPNNDNVNYIPEEVWNQLEETLCYLPQPVQRKILIIRTLGLRIGELLNLPLDCLRKRNNQWRLRLKETEKFKVEDELPIPEILVAIIREQQKYIRENFGDSYKKLFCSIKGNRHNFNYVPVGKVMNVNNFNHWLNRLAKKYNIFTQDGQLWHFSSHQFRRTVATIMTNAGVTDLIIQKYLRHRNLDMQNYYKHLLKEVIGDEYQELNKEKNFVNIEGKIVGNHKPQDIIEEYIRLRLHQITTQQGECHRSNLKTLCPTVNGCWRCGDWMTSEKDLPYLKEDLERLKDELKKTNKLGMIRVAKEIQKDLNYLQIRINALERITNND